MHVIVNQQFPTVTHHLITRMILNKNTLRLTSLTSKEHAGNFMNVSYFMTMKNYLTYYWNLKFWK